MVNTSTLSERLAQVWPKLEIDASIADSIPTELCVDSRNIENGSVFVALPGIGSHGVLFVGAAIASGALCVLVDENDINRLPTLSSLDSKKIVIVPDVSGDLFLLLKAFYPQVAAMKKVGVTGTNGKTTVSQLVAQLSVLCGQGAGVIGTMGAGIFELDDAQQKALFKPSIETANTTPHLVINYQLMAQLVEIGAEKGAELGAELKAKLVAMEVSSIGIDQKRVDELGFDVVIMTNLTQDHLDYHGDMQTYAQAKKQLFVDNPDAVMVLNMDDETASRWHKDFSNNHQVIAVGQYSAERKLERYLCYDQVRNTGAGFEFMLRSNEGDFKVSLPLFGQFNITNALCAMAAMVGLGVCVKALAEKLSFLSAVDGRMECFNYLTENAGNVKAIVDYAHTPDALDKALGSLRQHCQGELWCIFGCGGDRDKQKRPLMAKAAEQWADKIVVTNDNPRHELPQSIADDICTGFTTSTVVSVELDRKQAIANTLAQANDDDIVLIAGKGHETYQVFGDDVIEYDERAFVMKCCIDSKANKQANSSSVLC